jgi:hypothetical protein
VHLSSLPSWLDVCAKNSHLLCKMTVLLCYRRCNFWNLMRGQGMGAKHLWSKVTVGTARDPAVQKFAMLHDPSHEVKGIVFCQ